MIKPGMVVKTTSRYEREFERTIKPIRVKSVQDVNTHYLVTLQDGITIADSWLEPCLPTLGLLYDELNDLTRDVVLIKSEEGEELHVNSFLTTFYVYVIDKGIRISFSSPGVLDRWLLALNEDGEPVVTFDDDTSVKKPEIQRESFQDIIDTLIDYYSEEV